jgi:hypothetical protein
MIYTKRIWFLVVLLVIFSPQLSVWGNPAAWEERAREERALKKLVESMEQEMDAARKKVASEEYEKEKGKDGGGDSFGAILTLILIVTCGWQISKSPPTEAQKIQQIYNPNNESIWRYTSITLGIIVGTVALVAAIIFIFKTGFAFPVFGLILTGLSYFVAKNYAKDPYRGIVNVKKFHQGLIFFLVPCAFITIVALCVRFAG